MNNHGPATLNSSKSKGSAPKPILFRATKWLGVAFVSALIGFIISQSIGGFFYYLTPSSPDIKITSPIADQQIPYPVLVNVTQSGIWQQIYSWFGGQMGNALGPRIWIGFIPRTEPGVFYPAYSIDAGSEKWNGTISVGKADDTGAAFDIVIIPMSRSDDMRIQVYQMIKERAQINPGFDLHLITTKHRVSMSVIADYKPKILKIISPANGYTSPNGKVLVEGTISEGNLPGNVWIVARGKADGNKWYLHEEIDNNIGNWQSTIWLDGGYEPNKKYDIAAIFVNDSYNLLLRSLNRSNAIRIPNESVLDYIEVSRA